MIRIKNLNKTYFGGAPLHVLKGVNMDVKKGEFISIMGASGSGKSTLLNILGILDSYDTGEYYLDNTLIRDLSETRAAELRNQKIGFVFQSFNLISFKNAMENVALPLYYQGVSRKKRNIMAMEYLDKMGLKSHAEHLPSEMSGGQKQRVAIARALIAQPRIILADEPTGALDSKTSEEMIRILREVNKVEGVTMIIVTHEQAVAEATDRIIHIKDGIISSDDSNLGEQLVNDVASSIILMSDLQADEELDIVEDSLVEETIVPEDSDFGEDEYYEDDWDDTEEDEVSEDFTEEYLPAEEPVSDSPESEGSDVVDEQFLPDEDIESENTEKDIVVPSFTRGSFRIDPIEKISPSDVPSPVEETTVPEDSDFGENEYYEDDWDDTEEDEVSEDFTEEYLPAEEPVSDSPESEGSDVVDEQSLMDEDVETEEENIVIPSFTKGNFRIDPIEKISPSDILTSNSTVDDVSEELGFIEDEDYGESDLTGSIEDEEISEEYFPTEELMADFVEEVFVEETIIPEEPDYINTEENQDDWTDTKDEEIADEYLSGEEEPITDFVEDENSYTVEESSEQEETEQERYVSQEDDREKDIRNSFPREFRKIEPIEIITSSTKLPLDIKENEKLDPLENQRDNRTDMSFRDSSSKEGFRKIEPIDIITSSTKSFLIGKEDRSDSIESQLDSKIDMPFRSSFSRETRKIEPIEIITSSTKISLDIRDNESLDLFETQRDFKEHRKIEILETITPISSEVKELEDNSDFLDGYYDNQVVDAENNIEREFIEENIFDGDSMTDFENTLVSEESDFIADHEDDWTDTEDDEVLEDFIEEYIYEAPDVDYQENEINIEEEFSGEEISLEEDKESEGREENLVRGSFKIEPIEKITSSSSLSSYVIKEKSDTYRGVVEQESKVRTESNEKGASNGKWQYI